MNKGIETFSISFISLILNQRGKEDLMNKGIETLEIPRVGRVTIEPCGKEDLMNKGIET